MHTLDQNTSNVPAFLIKLWKLVEDHDCDDLISWSNKGDSFIIRHPATFAHDMLPKYFKHNNLASFIRQLNMYGFRKQANYEKCGMTVESEEMEFHHPFFLRGSEDLLELIKRKIHSAKGIEPTNHPKDFLTDLTSIRERQETMNNILVGMKKENELLWRELSSLRQKHKTQEQIIQKVIHFLVTIVQSSKQNIPVKRKIPHMLKDSPTSSAKRSRHIVDVVRGSGGNASDFFFSVSEHDDKATSPKGPVIHEVTEFDHEEMADIDKTPSNTESSEQEIGNSQPHIESPLSTPANNASPDNLIFLNSPFSVSSPTLCEKTNDEEVLGMPFDFVTENAESIDGDIMDIITVGDAKNTNHQQTLNLQVPKNSASIKTEAASIPVISIPEITNTNAKTTHVLPMPHISNNAGKAPILTITQTSNSTTKTAPTFTITQMPNNAVASTPVISIPETSNVISLPNNTSTNDGKVIIGSDIIPFSPSIMTLIYDNNNAVLPKNNVENASKTIQVRPASIGKKPSSVLIKAENNLKTNNKTGTSQNTLPKKNKSPYPLENQENTMQNNLQLELSDATTSTDTTWAKSAFSHHILNVDQQLDWLHDELTNSTLNLDSNMLLGLFSSDDSINNAIQSSQLSSEDIEPMKDPDNNIIGNELVQYKGSLDIDDLLYDNFDGISFLENMDENTSMDNKDAEVPNVKSSKTPFIKQEQNIDETCSFKNNSNLNQASPTKGKKSFRGRGRKKLK